MGTKPWVAHIISMRPQGTALELERRRFKAIGLLKHGYSYRAVAKMVAASVSSVTRWMHAYREEGGMRALRVKSSPGRPCRLSDKQKERLLEILSAGPLERGYASDSWTLKRIGQVIAQEFHVRYCLSNLWTLMTEGFGWSCQRPTKKARERNEAAIRYWMYQAWPRLKKSRSAWSPFGFSG